MVTMLIFLFFLLNLFTVTASNTIEKRPEFVNVFNSGIYSTYLNQRDAYLAGQEKALEQMAEEPAFVELHDLLTFKGERGSIYQTKVMTVLRDALAKKEMASPSTKEFLDNYTVWLFGAANIDAPLRQFLEECLPINFAQVAAEDPENAYMDVHNVIAKIPGFIEDKKTGRTLPPEDNFLHGDLPSNLFTWGPTEVIRTSNVAHDLTVDAKGKTITAAINPEFYNYIETLAARGEKHVYVNIMSRKNHEATKSFLIEELENDPKTAPGIVVIGLDKERSYPFYYQDPPYDTLDDAKEFKRLFLEKLLQPDGHYYWSMHLNQEEWAPTLSSLMDEVHTQYFHNSETLDRGSRKDFIDLTYVKIVEAIADKFQPKRLNITCKQAVDRGPTLYGLFYLYKQSKHGAIQTKDIEEAIQLIVGPALAFQNRATHVYRIDRFQTAANRLQRTEMIR